MADVRATLEAIVLVVGTVSIGVGIAVVVVALFWPRRAPITAGANGYACDPAVLDIAERFVIGLDAELERRLTAPQRKALTVRTVRALQQTIDEELEALRGEVE
jgi:hypothetical protein